MIRTEAEYQRALADIKRDAEVMRGQREHLQQMALTEAESARAMQPMESFYEQLKEEVEMYERMKRGDLGALYNLTSIGRWLIGLRIAHGMSQRQLADRLDVAEAQVSRDERNEYYGITVERAQRILEAFGARFKADIEDPVLEVQNGAGDLVGAA
jgi:DNA-binding XRE family transcriptional regulator